MTTPCPVCDGAAFSFLCEDKGWRWETCSGCGYVRLERNFTVEDAIETEGGEAPAEQYIESYVRRFDRKMARCRRRFRRIARRATGKRFLDVGSNYGFMIEIAGAAGYDAVGVEMNSTLAAAARERFPSRNFLEGPLELQDFGGRKFDVVYTSEVIEHTADPVAFLESIAAVMERGALLYLTTPHIREMTRLNYTAMGAPSHKLYFDNANMTQALKRTGFEKIRHEFTFFRGIKIWARRA